MGDLKIYLPSLEEFGAFDTWSALEKKVWATCKLGGYAYLPGKDDLPEDCDDPERRVRAGLIRYLMWGGSDEDGGARPHPKGVQIRGAWIEGPLDLQGCVATIDLSLQKCRFPGDVILKDAQIGALYLTGSYATQGLNLSRLKTQRDVHLRDGFQADGTVDLGSARIGGQFDCNGGAFKASKGRALNCDAAEIGADVFLRGGFEALGEVNFVRARIGGHLDCTGGAFKARAGRVVNFDAAEIGASVFLRGGFEARAEVNFIRAVVTGHVMVMPVAGQAPKLEAGIDFEGAKIGGGLFWKSVEGARERVNLTEAKVGSLRDDWAAWDGVGTLKLDGFQYDRVEGSMSVTRRLDWLGKACASMARPVEDGPGFDPQPHVQLAKVLREQGNRDGAARVLVDRETRQRTAEMARSHARLDGSVGAGFASLKDDARAAFGWLFGKLFGFGHRPMRAVVASLILIALAGLVNGIAFNKNQFAPNDAVILTSVEWQDAVTAEGAEGHPLLLWRDSDAFQDYETFNAGLYGLDLFLPLDALGQEDAWRATTGRGGWGNVAFYSRWFFQLSGIVIAAMGAAVLTGVVGRRD